MNFEDKFLEALADWLRTQGVDAREVEGYRQETDFETCGEGTCYYDWDVIDIEYRDASNELRIWTYSGSLTELMRELTD